MKNVFWKILAALLLFTCVTWGQMEFLPIDNPDNPTLDRLLMEHSFYADEQISASEGTITMPLGGYSGTAGEVRFAHLIIGGNSFIQNIGNGGNVTVSAGGNLEYGSISSGSVSGEGNIQQSDVVYPVKPKFPDIREESGFVWPQNLAALNISADETVTLEPGIYYFNNIGIGGTLNVKTGDEEDAVTVIYVRNDIRGNPGSPRINVIGQSGRVVFIVGGNIQLTQNTGAVHFTGSFIALGFISSARDFVVDGQILANRITFNTLHSTVNFVPFSGSLSEPTEAATVVWDEQDTFVFNGTPQGPSATARLADGTPLPISITGSMQINAGTYTATAKLTEPNPTITLRNPAKNFTINKAQGEGSVSMASWVFGNAPSVPVPFSETNGIEGVTYIYEGDDGGYPPTTARPANVGSYTVTATFPETDNHLGFTATTGFVISGANATALEVVWTEQTEFVYNRMVQVPIPSIKDRPDIDLIVLNGQSAVGQYSRPLSAIALIVDESLRLQHFLQNNTIEYSIVRRSLDVVMRQDGKIVEEPIVVERESEIVTEEYLANLLRGFIGYDNFAQDTVSGEWDNESNSLSGTLDFVISPANTARGARSLSGLENGEYIAEIISDHIVSRNYQIAPTRKIVVTINNDEIVFSRGEPTSIRNTERRKNSSGIRFTQNPALDKAEIFVADETITRVVIFDALGNLVFDSPETVWNLRNTTGRYVANGAYLVIVETRDRNGKAQRYSARLGVKR